jgi:hypothetical protein
MEKAKNRRQIGFENVARTTINVDVMKMELRRHRSEVTIYPWMIEELAKGERSLREWRLHLESLLADEPRTCARCRTPMSGRADKKYCSDACRIEAHLAAKRRADPGPRRSQRIQPLRTSE